MDELMALEELRLYFQNHGDYTSSGPPGSCGISAEAAEAVHWGGEGGAEAARFRVRRGAAR
jgi:hypothetical protein